MTEIENLIEMQENRIPQENEYTDSESGFIYCSKCRTSKQMKLFIFGRNSIVPIMCSCEKEQAEKEKALKEEREFNKRVERLRADGLKGDELYGYRFENDKGYNPEIEKAHIYVDKWDEMLEKASGFIVWGGVGTGKTFFAGCIANALIDKGVPVLMTNFADILNIVTGKFSEERSRYIENLNRYSLLIIDDLGIERCTEFALENIYNVIDSRYRSGKPMILTTNLTLQEMKGTDNLMYSRIYSRILERCLPLMINNINIRNEKSASNIAEAKKVFSSANK